MLVCPSAIKRKEKERSTMKITFNHKIGKTELRKKAAKSKFRFVKKVRQYEIGYHYAWYAENHRKMLGVFTPECRNRKRGVELLVRDTKRSVNKVILVPHASILLDPWAACSQVPREKSPRSVLYVPDRVKRKYGKTVGQRLMGKKVVYHCVSI
jgi:hypothetical protein